MDLVKKNGRHKRPPLSDPVNVTFPEEANLQRGSVSGAGKRYTAVTANGTFQGDKVFKM